MSWASKNLFDPLKAFLGGSSNPVVQDASDKLTAASDAIGAALPALGAEAANKALAGAPPIVQGFEPLFDLFIEEAISALLAKHSNPPAAHAAVAPAS